MHNHLTATHERQFSTSRPEGTALRVAFLTASLSRAGAGVFESVRGLARALAARPGVKVEVFGLADDGLNAESAAWAPLRPKAGKVQFLQRFGYSPELRRLTRHSSSQLIHAHGLWMYPSLACLRWASETGRPYLVSPHGMLDPWALRRSAWKKRIVGALFQNRHLRRAGCLHALCDAERQAMRALGFTNPIAVVPNGVDLRDAPSQSPPWEGQLGSERRVVLFLGRLHEKKGVLPLLAGWARFRASARDASNDWALAVAGAAAPEDGYADTLRRAVDDLGLDKDVAFLGPIYGDAKWAAFAQAAAFVLPSVSEGLPVAVLEAWSQGCPTLITEACNLPEGFTRDAALRIGTDPDAIARGLSLLAGMSQADREAMGQQGRVLVEEKFSWRVVASQTDHLYRWLLGGGSAPDFVSQ